MHPRIRPHKTASMKIDGSNLSWEGFNASDDRCFKDPRASTRPPLPRLPSARDAAAPAVRTPSLFPFFSLSSLLFFSPRASASCAAGARAGAQISPSLLLARPRRLLAPPVAAALARTSCHCALWRTRGGRRSPVPEGAVAEAGASCAGAPHVSGHRRPRASRPSSLPPSPLATASARAVHSRILGR